MAFAAVQPESDLQRGASPKNEQGVIVQGFQGVNLLQDPALIADNELQLAQNWVPRVNYGLASKMAGSSKINSTAIVVSSVNASRVVAGLRGYLQDTTTKATILVCHMASGADQVIGLNGNVVTALTGGSALPSQGTPYALAMYNNALWLASNGTLVQTSGDFATKSDGASWLSTGPHILPYKDRLVVAGRATARNQLNFSNTGAPGVENASSPIVVGRIGDWITGLGLINVGTSGAGFINQLLIFMNTQVWRYDGDLGASGSTLHLASSRIGCMAPSSIATTPIGTMFVGIEDGRVNVYLVRTTGEPVAVGTKIQSTFDNIPSAQWTRPTAIYHGGFYKLSIPDTAGTTNTLEWWADLRGVPAGLPIVWWGPHKGLAIRCYVPWDGASDDGRLTCGDDTAGTLWQREVAGFAVGGTTLSSILKTKEFDWGKPQHQKLLTRSLLGHASQSTGNITVDVIKDTQTAVSKQVTLNATGALWGSGVWGTDVWGGLGNYQITPFRYSASRLRGYRLALQLTHALNSDITLSTVASYAIILPRIDVS